MQREQRLAALASRQFGYPLPFRGQVCRVQRPLPCFPSMVLHSRRLPSLGRVSMGSIPRPPAVLRRRYDSPLRMALTLMVFAPALHADLLVRASPKRSRPAGEAARARTVGSLGRPLCRVARRVGEYGVSQVPWRSFPCLCQAPGPRSDPRWQAITPSRCCPHSEENEGSGEQSDFGAYHLASAHAVYASGTLSPGPCKTRFRLAG